LQEINVLDHLIENHVAGQIANGLMDLDDDSAVRAGGEADRLDVRVDDCPLAGPVVADFRVAMESAAFHSVRPIHILVHGFENCVDVAGVEVIVCGG